jgi:hypothetical protein
MWDIQSIRIQVKKGISPIRISYMEIQGQGVIPLTRTNEKFLLHKNWTKSCQLAYFFRIPIEVFWVSF